MLRPARLLALLLVTLAAACRPVDPGGSRLPEAGNPDGSCTSIALPAEASPANTSSPDHVVGTGTPESCTFAELQGRNTRTATGAAPTWPSSG